jgi:hypothetical protein
MSLNIIVGESVLLLPSPGQVKKPLIMEELVYLGKKNDLNILIPMAQNDVRDQKVGSDRLDKARGVLAAAEKGFYAAHNGLSESQRRKTQEERNHLWDCAYNCLCELIDAI